jgi:hypothetical protein
MPASDESNAARLLRANPALRERIRASEEFQRWRTGFKEIEVDGSKYFIARGEPMVSGGDRLMDEDELMFEWAQISGLAKSLPETKP